MDIQKNIQLAAFTTFKIGGPAKEFVVVKNKAELVEALQYARQEYLPYYILGGGSNIFFDDRGFDGLVIKLAGDREMKLTTENGIYAWAGENLGSVVNFAKENGLSGMESLAGIPGTLGGAARGNAGAFGTSMSDLVEAVEVIDTDSLEIKTLRVDECHFAYRLSLFKESTQFIVLTVELKLQAGEREVIEGKIKEVIRQRSEKQPTGWVGCAGSFFENPRVDKPELIVRFEKETGAKSQNGKVPAGWLIGEAGLKGRRIGGIEVNEKHANFVVNIGGATAQDLVMMASFIKQQVRDDLGVQLKEEVMFIGY